MRALWCNTEQVLIKANSCSSSSLIRDFIEKQFRTSSLPGLSPVGAGLPLMFMGMTQPEAIGPVTLAGSMVVVNTEVLSCLVVIQLAYPGSSVIYSTGIAAFDMKASMRAGGGPEHALTGAASGELARYYGMPSIVGGAWFQVQRNLERKQVMKS